MATVTGGSKLKEAIMATVTGGSKLKEALAKIANQLRSANSVEVGFIDGRTYPDGTSVAMVALTQEFGGRIKVPEHEVTVYRKINEDGDFANDGRFVKASKSNFSSTHTVPAHTINIPPRSFFRNMIKDKSGNWPANLLTALKLTKYDAKKALNLVGQSISEDLQESIRSNTPPPNAKSTVKAKGSSQTLIASHLMLESVSHNVK